MRRKWMLATLGAAILLPVVCVLYLTRETPTHFKIYQIETVISWPDNPDIELNPQSMEKLNHEIADLLKSEVPGLNLEYPVVSLGKKRVEVMYMSGKQGVPASLQKTLDSFIQRRISELAKGQVLTSQSK